MPIRRVASDAGIFDETELALLGRVFDKLKLEQRLPDTLDAIASRVIANYMAGIKDEAELLSLSRWPLRR
ncbi:hypothetical protein EFV37_24975 [Mesorhizobium loti]|uniref:Uncharacterized protein n=1 Tax=Mesorhizobium jarvisii TaxID=1777867 RepID=A0A6M7TQ96_9HYPH|nr:MULTISPECIES: hypothetical protein [Mesorhizobium]OBQ69389.1 hypothetical protein A9K72_09240 [Mesorhizobium loti]QKC67221.1 hypothetical protein EB229_24970 [Mesorhizobium jarvisii]QKD13132.1 hypothetical protein EFV37_24975 [Mesorhizobium loti]RJT31320.1 hypothetical protein D3242_22965 [Mesorhizobium jarvisii]